MREKNKAETLRVAIIGTASRSSYLYGPLIRGLSAGLDLELVGVWGRSEHSAGKLGKELEVPWYTDLHALVDKEKPHLGIVSVAYEANGEVGKMAASLPLHLLLETPIAHDPGEAREIIRRSREQGCRIEVAEQFHRRPLEQIKLKLLSTGIFGEVHSSFNDFLGHGYHGVSVLRSYLGFNLKALSVSGAVGHYGLTGFESLIDGHIRSGETQEHGIIRFENGKLGFFHWTDIGYESALRWWRSSRFLAERGMGVSMGTGPGHSTQLTLLDPTGRAPREIRIERKYERIDGGCLMAMEAFTGLQDMPLVRWENPLVMNPQGQNRHWNDDEIGVALCLKSLVDAIRQEKEPGYGPLQALTDQLITLAMRESADMGGIPVEIRDEQLSI